MADAFVQVAPDSSGKKMQTFENTVGANVVEAEAVTLVRSTDNTEVGTTAQPVRVDPTGTTVQPVSGNVNQALGTPGFEAITDGVVGPVAVKAASTTPTVTDKALVVAISPNSPTIQTLEVNLNPAGVATTGKADYAGNLLTSLAGDNYSPYTVQELLYLMLRELQTIRTILATTAEETGAVREIDYNPGSQEFVTRDSGDVLN